MNCHYFLVCVISVMIFITLPAYITSNRVSSELVTHGNRLALFRRQEHHLQAIKGYFMKQFNRSNALRPKMNCSNSGYNRFKSQFKDTTWKKVKSNDGSDGRIVYQIQESGKFCLCLHITFTINTRLLWCHRAMVIHKQPSFSWHFH